MKSITSISRRSFSLCLAACALVVASASHAQDLLENILKSKTIKIAIPIDYAPYGSVGTDMQPRGLDIDMAKLIAARLGVTPELIPVTSANRVAYLQTGKAQLVVSTLGKTPEREKMIDYASAYSPYFQAVFAAKNVSIKSWADLAGKSVAVVRGGMEDIELGKVMPAGVQIKRFDDNNTTVAAFVAGQTQVIATSASVAAQLIEKNPSLNAEYKLLIKDSPNYVGLPKGEETLKARINKIIAEARANGELEAMSKRWLGRGTGDLPL